MICLLLLKLSGWIAHTSLFTLLLVEGCQNCLIWCIHPIFSFLKKNVIWTIPATWLPSVESQVEWLEICCKRKALMGARDWAGDSHCWVSSSSASSLPRGPFPSP